MSDDTGLDRALDGHRALKAENAARLDARARAAIRLAAQCGEPLRGAKP